uniref:Uncharacterized protein n=1 Tax=Glossina palpalis gambiensis TaxID=67801 RepID=A0A1B0AP17_9MUSC
MSCENIKSPNEQREQLGTSAREECVEMCSYMAVVTVLSRNRRRNTAIVLAKCIYREFLHFPTT